MRPDDGTIRSSPNLAALTDSQLTQFTRFCEMETGREFASYDELYSFSVKELAQFWVLFLRWSEMLCEGSPEPVCTDEDSCEHAVFFPNLSLSYVDNVLRIDSPEDAERPAVVAHHASSPPDRLSRGQLRNRVLAVAAYLQRLGVRPGDRIVAVARNNAETVVAGLATAAIGATFSSATADMGALTILSRFQQLEPSVLMANFSFGEEPASSASADRLDDVVRGLCTLTAVIALDDGEVPQSVTVPVHRLAHLVEQHAEISTDTALARFPFNHPLFVLFSSGTTGPPKCIVHGAGGTLLEHVKEHRLHLDLRAEDTLFFQTSVAWMMWNWQLSALACGATIVLYDGPVTGADTLWRIAAAEQVTVFGTSPPYLQLCEDSAYSPRQHLSLPALRAVLSTGSILHDTQYDWVRDHVGQIPLQSISGGTDIIGCFALGNPNLPVHRGEIQCRSLGLDVRARPTPTTPSGSNVGELVCCGPFPNRPLGFVGDVDGRRFHEAYFSQNEGMWTHGDLVEISPSGHIRMHGRSDGVLNVLGVRIGPAEIYRVLRDIPAIREAMAVQQETPDGPDPARVVLLVVMHEPGALDARLTVEIRQALARRASPVHVPRVIVEVDELPCTHSGKRSESAARAAVNGVAATNLDALSNPHSVDNIARYMARADDRPRARAAGSGDASDEMTESRLRTIWEDVLGIAPLESDDDFFDVGGTSLAAVRMLYAVYDRLGVDLPVSTLLHAKTIATLAAVIDAHDVADLPLVLPLKPGTIDRPLFVVHSLSGDLLDVRALTQRLNTDRPVYGVRAQGLYRQARPHERVEDMAEEYVRHIRAIQPEGPYALAGYSFGGLVASEMARALIAAGQDVDSLTLIDTYIDYRNLTPRSRRTMFRLLRAFHLVAGGLRMPGMKVPRFFRRVARTMAPWLPIAPPSPWGERLSPLALRVWNSNMAAYESYRPSPYPGSATFVEADDRDQYQCDPVPIWSRVFERGLRVERVSGGHRDIMHVPQVQVLADLLVAQLS